MALINDLPEGKKMAISEAFDRFMKNLKALNYLPFYMWDWFDAVLSHPSHMVGEVILIARFRRRANDRGTDYFFHELKAAVVHSIDFDTATLNHPHAFGDLGGHSPRVLDPEVRYPICIQIDLRPHYSNDLLYDGPKLAEQYLGMGESRHSWYLVGFKRSL